MYFQEHDSSIWNLNVRRNIMRAILRKQYELSEDNDACRAAAVIK